MSAWIESHTDLADHPKLNRLGRLLDTPAVTLIGHLHLLWWWCLTYADAGDLSDYEPGEIAAAARWTGDGVAFVDALVRSGFLDAADGYLAAHDWYDYAGKLIEQRAAAAERQQRARDKQKTTMQPDVTSPSRNGHVTVTSPSRNALTVPNQTIPDLSPLPPKGDDGDDEFKQLYDWFRANYPFRNKKALYPAKIREALKKIPCADWDLLKTCVLNFARSDQARRNYAPDAQRWLARRDWTVWAEPEQSVQPVTPNERPPGFGDLRGMNADQTKAYAAKYIRPRAGPANGRTPRDENAPTEI